MDDSLLVRRMLAGEEVAFDEFFNGYFPRLFRFACSRVGDPDAAEEIVQATLVIALRKLATWRGEAPLFTWLCTFCRHEISAHYRRLGKHAEVTSMDDVPEIRAQLEAITARAADRPDTALDKEELARLVRLTLDYLPVRYGDVLEWKYIECVPVAEIAARLRATPKAAESLLTRARAAFREGFTALTGWSMPDILAD